MATDKQEMIALEVNGVHHGTFHNGHDTTMAFNGYLPFDVTGLQFTDLFDLAEIQELQDAFARATGVASVITDTQGKPITAPSGFCDLCQLIRGTHIGLRNCMHSDAALGKVNPDGPVVQPCLSGGLLDGGTSILVGHHHIANWLIGQVLDDTIDAEKMMAYAHEIGADEDHFREALGSVRRMSRQQFEDVCSALFLMARQLSRMALQNAQRAYDIEQQKQQQADMAAMQEQIIAAQQHAIRELSTPMLPLADGVVALPLVGAIDSMRAQQVMETLLEGVAQHRARVAIVDITGVQVVDTQVAQSLLFAAQGVRLLGAEVVLTGIRPEIAQTLVHLGAKFEVLVTRSTLQAGIAYALGR